MAKRFIKSQKIAYYIVAVVVVLGSLLLGSVFLMFDMNLSGEGNMEKESVYSNYDQIMEIIANGSLEQFEKLSQTVKGFPNEKDDFISRHWITNAIDCGSKSSVEWMLSKDVNLVFRDEEGYTPLLSAIDRERPDKYEVLELLLKHGAPINKKGINDWTPLHMAAARNDVVALKLLVKYGADLGIRTEIDDYATPLEEARNLGRKEAVKYLESVSR